MIEGVVSAHGLPIVSLRVADEDRVAIVDTGFNGDLELPDSLRDNLNARHLGRLTCALGGGKTIEEEVYLVDFPFDGRTVQAEVTFVPGSDILLGTKLMREHRLEVDFCSGLVRLTWGV